MKQIHYYFQQLLMILKSVSRYFVCIANEWEYELDAESRSIIYDMGFKNKLKELQRSKVLSNLSVIHTEESKGKLNKTKACSAFVCGKLAMCSYIKGNQKSFFLNKINSKYIKDPKRIEEIELG